MDTAVWNSVDVMKDAGNKMETAVGDDVHVLTRGCAREAAVGGDGVVDAAALALNPVDTMQMCVSAGGSFLPFVGWGRAAVHRQAALRGGGGGVTYVRWVFSAGAGSLAVFTTETGRVGICNPRNVGEINAVTAFLGPVTGLDCGELMLAVCDMGYAAA